MEHFSILYSKQQTTGFDAYILVCPVTRSYEKKQEPTGSPLLQNLQSTVNLNLWKDTTINGVSTLHTKYR